MWLIIAGLIVEAVGISIGMSAAAEPLYVSARGAKILASQLFITLPGFVMMLFGIRKFFVQPVLDELKKLFDGRQAK